MSEDSFKNLRELLENEYNWPANYQFKFVALSEDIEKVIEKVGDGDVSRKNSRTGKYVSVTIEKRISSTQEVIEVYKRVSKVKSVISL